jgi:nucleoid-associated protein YgaU
MNRYIDTLQRIESPNAPAYYASSIPTSIPTEAVPFYYEARDGDRLDTISNIFYKTPNNWWIIAQANQLSNGTLTVPAGTVLRIPNL